jgi:hypothetical protein
MQVFFQWVQRFAPILGCALPVHAIADAPRIVQSKAYVESRAAETLPVILTLLREAGQRIQSYHGSVRGL